MKQLAALIVAVPLLGCGPSFPTIDKAALMEAVAQVRVQTIKVCSYIPSDESLISILTVDLPFAETAFNIAQQICAAVTASVPPLNPVQLGGERLGDANPCPMLRGTCITGQFLQTPVSPTVPPPTRAPEIP